MSALFVVLSTGTVDLSLPVVTLSLLREKKLCLIDDLQTQKLCGKFKLSFSFASHLFVERRRLCERVLLLSFTLFFFLLFVSPLKCCQRCFSSITFPPV